MVTVCTTGTVSRPVVVAHWWTRGGEVFGWSTSGEGQRYWSRRETVRLTEQIKRWWGGRKRPVRRRSDGGRRLSRVGQSGIDPARR
jgi:hypothetical protein